MQKRSLPVKPPQRNPLAIYSQFGSKIYRFQKWWFSQTALFPEAKSRSDIPALPCIHVVSPPTFPNIQPSPLHPQCQYHTIPSRRRSHRPGRCARSGCDPVRRCSDCSRGTWPLPRERNPQELVGWFHGKCHENGWCRGVSPVSGNFHMVYQQKNGKMMKRMEDRPARWGRIDDWHND